MPLFVDSVDCETNFKTEILKKDSVSNVLTTVCGLIHRR